MFYRVFSSTAKAFGLLVLPALIAAGVFLSSPDGFGSGEPQSAEAAIEVDANALSPLHSIAACADLNGDGMVTLVDLLIQLTYYLQTVPPAPLQADLDGNGTVLISDIIILIKHYNTATACQSNPIGPGGTPKATPTPAATPAPEPEMSLNVTSAGAVCDHPQKPTKCTVPPDSQFTLVADVNHAPVKGYIGFQTQVVYGSLKYKPTGDNGAAEVVWPDGVAPFGGFEVRIGPVTGQERVVHHLATNALALPPYPVSNYEDSIVEIALNCPPSGSFEVALPVLSVANPSGTHFVKSGMFNALPRTVGQELVDVDGDTTPELVDVAATLSINCAPLKLPFKGDTDGDGCADVNENLPKAQHNNGGGRDWEDPYDYYDVNGDGVIDLLYDILGVIQHYQPTPGGAPPYAVAYDRGPTTGPNAWNMTAPDGVIDLLNDILGVILQYQPTGCTLPA